MKRSPLQRRTPLRSVSQLRSRPKKVSRTEAEWIWKQPVSGFCQCGCGKFALRLQRHHVVYEQHVRKDRGDVWDLANSMLLAPRCHEHHHSAWRRLPLESVPSPALAFAVDLMGEDRAALYFARLYASDVSWRDAA